MRIIGVNFPEFRKNGGAIVSAVYVLNAEGFERKSPPENLHVHFKHTHNHKVFFVAFMDVSRKKLPSIYLTSVCALAT